MPGPELQHRSASGKPRPSSSIETKISEVRLTSHQGTHIFIYNASKTSILEHAQPKIFKNYYFHTNTNWSCKTSNLTLHIPRSLQKSCNMKTQCMNKMMHPIIYMPNLDTVDLCDWFF